MPKSIARYDTRRKNAKVNEKSEINLVEAVMRGTVFTIF